MKKIRRIIEHFEMMGYDVILLEDFECIIVSLTTHNRYRVNRRVTFDELGGDFIVEFVVRDLNEAIVREL